MDRIDRLVHTHMASGTFPCAEVLVAHGERVRLHKAYGFMEGSDIAPLHKGALFDLASLTKPLATAQLLVTLAHKGKIALDAPVRQYLPDLRAAQHHDFTVRQLALHQAGFAADDPFAKNAENIDAAWHALFDIGLAYPPGTQMVYSCLGYLLLGKIIERVTGLPLDQAFALLIAEPLGLRQTMFTPLEVSGRRPPIVPTVPTIRRSGYIRGMVNDSTARCLGGKVGNAGLFSTAEEVHKMACHLLAQHDPLFFENGNRAGLTPRTIGFEYHDLKYAGASCGDHFGPGAIGHTGFTGTSLWLDPKSDLIVIALTNRVYASYRESIPAMRQFRIDLHAAAQKI
ncbi:serine hydrolase domain-containing protein [Maritalea mediterranea]|uniref:Beta-lactamase family protein n=1 Tax=Maritalea mediterranea TaxID=2909667 RepID=A0ABS9E3E4_9HYPH|nr:serine hydrolase domain-containing protein [Maritalea mediterranea]MCF4097376.1 beta-lactamase family protein [Maritalea mediterranea]